jgi:hypothetical protein
MNVIANINISSPTGRKTVKGLEKQNRVVQLKYEEELPNNSISLDEAVDVIWNQLEQKMGSDIRKLEK